MEESAREKFRRKLHRLLASAFFVVLVCGPAASVVSETGSQEVPQVLVETESSVLTVAQPWKLTLLIQYPAPEDVKISLPPIPGSLVLDRIRTEVRMISKELWTAVEYTFIPKTAGPLMLGPFEIRIQGKRLLSTPQALTVQDAAGAVHPYTPRLFWAGSTESAQVGSPLVLELHLEGYDPKITLPEGITALSVQLVQNALVESLSVSDQERGRGVLYRIRLIPLNQGELYLPEATVRLGRDPIRSEPRRLMVAEGQTRQLARPSAEPAGSQNRRPLQGTHRQPAPAFPELPEYQPEFPWALLWPLLSGHVQPLLQESRTLWQAGEYAKALATIRKQERDSLAGPIYRRVRKIAEGKLGITSGPDEWWLPRGLLYPVSALGLGVALFLGLKKRKTAGIVFLACSGLILVYSMVGQTMLIPALRGGSIAVIQEQDTAARTIPEKAGSVSTHFAVGEGVLIHHSTGSWVFVSASGQRSGWVLLSSICRY
jgi:hypothetical protein